MHPPARQPTTQKGPDSSAMDLALHASDLLLASTQQHQNQNHDPQCDMDMEPASCEEPQDTLPAPSPLMHFPHCRLEITTFPTPNGPGKLEQIALPGALVRTLLSRFESDLQQQEDQYQQHQQRHHHHNHQSTPHTPPSPPTTSSSSPSPPTTKTKPHPALTRGAAERRRPVRIQPHFDDAADWVFSRCLLADFTGFREDEADALSTAAGAGRLCCWASVVLLPPRGRGRGSGRRGCGNGSGRGSVGSFDGDEDEEDEDYEGGYQGEGLQGLEGEDGDDEGRWELQFVVQRVGVRDPGSGWCECF
ncbi:uncharacterized protein B0H64DRAFT_449140 [Chaetomium fimeti]|uniref:Uncharacterized protein n=1 Tax=Chaetomium fimeti TaxID=1854472 RepID=A0AAE0HQW1_9PEZI|nr:hypothetical protein B0H64DRAFT_449140 [Chaetomium fimeti]